MINILFIIAIIAFIGCLLHIIWRYKKERAIRNKRDEHLKWIDSRIEEMAKQDPSIIAEDLAQNASHHAIRDLWGFPPLQAVVIEEIMSGKQVATGWDYAVNIHEGAEQYLGSAQFNKLEERFASIPGIDKCKQEDREVFLVRTKSLSSDEIRKLFWEQFLLASEISMNIQR